jgi:hypothetical protein
VVQGVEHLPSKYNTLSANPSVDSEREREREESDSKWEILAK